MSDNVTVLVKRPSIFWLPAMRGPKNKDGVRPPVCGKMKLLPGANDVPKRRWDASANHPAVKTYIDLGVLVVNPSAEDKTAHTVTPDKLDGLTKMTIPKAVVWIEACTDQKQLEKWRNQDERKGIRAAIDSRIEDLQEDDGAGGDGDASADDDPLADEDFE